MTLTLMENGSEKPKTRIQQLVIAYRVAYAEKMGRESNMTWGHMIGRIKKKFETVDPETGEELIEYPDSKAWEEEIHGFFVNEFAATCRPPFPFDLFLSRFGQYAVVEVKKHKPHEVVNPWNTCEKCGRCFPKGGECKHAGDAYGQTFKHSR